MASGSILPTASSSDPKPFQFSLAQLLVIVTCICLVAGAVYWVGFAGIFLAGIVIPVGTLLAFGWSRLKEATVIAAIVCLLAAFFAPALPPYRGSTRTQCVNRLRQIGIALHNYHDVYGAFPPAYVADANGKPMHSWRVLILPFMDRNDLYQAYRFDEPWDGPNNRKLQEQIGKMCRCPQCSANQPKTETNYMAVIGPQTIWREGKSTSLANVADGTSNTIMVVEVHNSGVHWMEPRDLHVTQMPVAINAPKGTGISSPHGKASGANVLYADAHTQFLKNELPPAVLQGLLTIAGGEKVEAP